MRGSTWRPSARNVTQVIFRRSLESEEACLLAMKSDYDKAKWNKLAAWKAGGSIPQHYILPKYKDIVAKCEDVMAKKGT